MQPDPRKETHGNFLTGNVALDVLFGIEFLCTSLSPPGWDPAIPNMAFIRKKNTYQIPLLTSPWIRQEPPQSWVATGSQKTKKKSLFLDGKAKTPNRKAQG